MIISAHTDSVYYKPDNMQYDVYLDGIKQRWCYLANEDDGYIERYKSDDKGNLVLTSNREEIQVEKIYGKICIVKRKGE